MNLAITIDAPNEVIAVICLFFLCFGIASLLHYVLALIIQGRAFEHDRKRQQEIAQINLSDTVK